MSVSDAAHPGSVRKAQFAMVPMWVHRRIVATRTRTLAHAVYIELVGQYAGSSKGAEGLRVWPEMQQIADSMDVPKSSVERALKVLIGCGVVLKKRTVRRNQYWLPQEDPGPSAETLAGFQTVTSDGLDSVQTVTSDGPGTVTSDGPQTVTSDGLCNPDPSIQTQETHLSLASVVTTAEDARAQGAVPEEREISATPSTTTTTTTTAAAAAVRLPAQRGEQRQQQEQDVDQGRDAATAPVAPPQTAQQGAGVSQAAQAVVDAYTAALGRPLLTSTRTKLHDQAAEALEAGFPEPWLAARARELAANGWTDLAKHVEHSKAPLPGTRPTTATSNGLPPWCRNPDCSEIDRMRETDDDGYSVVTRCPDCHPANAAATISRDQGGYQSYQQPSPQDFANSRDFNGRPLSTADKRSEQAFAVAEQLRAEESRPLPGPDTNLAGWAAVAASFDTEQLRGDE